MNINFLRLDPLAKMPTKGSADAAAFDLTAVRVEHDTKRHQIVVYSGVAVEIPVGYAGLCFPRSSICKTPWRLSNCVGVIDADYRGEITAVFDDHWLPGLGYNVGDRFCQLMIVAIPCVEWCEAKELSQTARGLGGYGSTGR